MRGLVSTSDIQIDTIKGFNSFHNSDLFVSNTVLLKTDVWEPQESLGSDLNSYEIFLYSL